MIKTVLHHINTQLEQLNLFNKYFTLTEKIKREDKEFPAIFESEFKGINFDFHPNVIYHRLNGEPSFAEVESQVGCGTDFIYTIPLKLVAYLKQETQYNLLDIGEQIAILLFKSNSSALKTLLNAYSTAITSRNINANSQNVFSEEFSNVNQSTADFISVDYDVVINGSKNCLLTLECDPVETCYVKVFDEDGNIILSGTCGNNYTINIDGTILRFIFGTIPLTGTDIQDRNGNSIGTWVDTSEIFIPELVGKNIDQYDVSVDQFPLEWKHADDTINTLDDSLTGAGTLKLFTGRDLFQRGAQIKILL